MPPKESCFWRNVRHSGPVRTILITIVYLAIGVVFYMAEEDKDCDTHNAAIAATHGHKDCKESWTFVDALYFSVTTISTVGYGDMTPSTDHSKVFTCIYIFFGITIVFSEVGNACSGGLEFIEQAFLHKVHTFDKAQQMSGSAAGLSGKAIDLNGDGKANFVLPPPAWKFWTLRLAPWVTIIILLQFVSAALFCVVEPEMVYGDAFYHSFVTATTVGYGDIPLTTQSARAFATFHIMLSVTFLAAMVGRVYDLAEFRSMRLQRSRVLQKCKDPEWIVKFIRKQHLDHGGKGVHKLEFVIGMLTYLGVELCGRPLAWEDIKPIIVTFEKADINHDGNLTKQEEKAYATRVSEEMQEIVAGAEKKHDDKDIGDGKGDGGEDGDGGNDGKQNDEDEGSSDVDSDGNIKVFIESELGDRETIRVIVEADDIINTVKGIIKNMTASRGIKQILKFKGIPKYQQTLKFKGTTLADDSTLSENGIVDGSTIVLALGSIECTV